MESLLSPYRQPLRSLVPTRAIGHVTQVHGLSIEVEGLRATVGELFTVAPSAESGIDVAPVLAEVIAVKTGSILMMPYGPVHGLSSGCEVQAAGTKANIGVGEQMLGR